MKKSLSGVILILGLVLVTVGVLGAFQVMEMGKFTWIAIVLGVLFFPAGISLMKSTESE